jgi:hypothetical protein
MHRTATTAVLLAALILPAPLAAQQRVDLVVYGRVWTGDSARPWAEAVAVHGERIVAVGRRTDVRRLVGPRTRVLDNGTGLVTPGLGDAHTHLVDGGFQLVSVDLRDADTAEEFVRRLASFAGRLPPGRWITGGDWDHERWAGAPLPRREWIDSVTARNPVFVTRLDGHMGVANSLALRLAGVDRHTPEPSGGEIVRDPATGEITGVLKDNAMNRMHAAIPPPSAEETDSAVARAMRHAASHGVTTVHVMGSWRDFAALRRARTHGVMSTRVRAYVPIESWRVMADTVRSAGRGDAWLAWGGLKGFMDGSLGSTTAAFFAPYLDAPHSRGLLVADSVARLGEVTGADSAGLQLAIHAIGDRANAMLLAIYEETVRHNGRRDRRFRIEHAQHLRLTDIPRLAAARVIASMQPYHVIDDGRWAGNRLDSARLAGTYAFRSLLEQAAPLAFGSDWTVAPLEPVLGLYAAVTRRTLDGRNPEGWIPEQRIGLEDALRAYTTGVAYAAFDEDELGVLRPGFLADLVLFDRDLFAVPPATLDQARVRATIVGGRVVYERR